MSRILMWYIPEITGDGTRQGPTFYAEKDYTPGEVRIYASDAPDAADLEIDIKDDGASICKTPPALLKGENSQDWASNFDTSVMNIIEEGSWISLDITQAGGAKKITVQLELSDEDE